jgi:hypothetical protein
VVEILGRLRGSAIGGFPDRGCRKPQPDCGVQAPRS